MASISTHVLEARVNGLKCVQLKVGSEIISSYLHHWMDSLHNTLCPSH